MNKLPNKLSDCIDLTLRDLSAVERQKKKYEVRMDEAWHDPYSGEKCVVCFAGAVMAKTLATNPIMEVCPSSFNSHNRARLMALDMLRKGEIRTAFDYVGKEVPFGVAGAVEVTDYDFDPKQFKSDMRRIAKLLRAVGA